MTRRKDKQNTRRASTQRATSKTDRQARKLRQQRRMREARLWPPSWL